MDGLQETRFLELGFNVSYYREVRDALEEILRDWSTPVFNPKYKDSLHPLTDLFVESWVDFYTHLTADLKYYHTDLVPFDAIVIRMGYIGLVLPGVGDDRYLPMAHKYSTISLTNSCLLMIQQFACVISQHLV
jgi:hypothetical protein